VRAVGSLGSEGRRPARPAVQRVRVERTVVCNLAVRWPRVSEPIEPRPMGCLPGPLPRTLAHRRRPALVLHAGRAPPPVELASLLPPSRLVCRRPVQDAFDSHSWEKDIGVQRGRSEREDRQELAVCQRWAVGFCWMGLPKVEAVLSQELERARDSQHGVEWHQVGLLARTEHGGERPYRGV